MLQRIVCAGKNDLNYVRRKKDGCVHGDSAPSALIALSSFPSFLGLIPVDQKQFVPALAIAPLSLRDGNTEDHRG